MRKVILWDFDGTLAIREGGWTGALGEVLARYAPEITAAPEQVRSFLHTGFPWHEPMMPHTHLNDDPDAWWRALDAVFLTAFEGVGVAPDRAAELVQCVRGQYLAPVSWRRFDDALPALEALADQGWRQVLVSNHAPELPRILIHLGLSDWFAAIINSATCGYEKPHPAIFQRALQEAGPADIVWMIGDSYQADVLGAEALGISAILVRRPRPEARYACSDLSGALEIIACR